MYGYAILEEQRQYKKYDNKGKGQDTMHITITGKNIDLTDGLKSAVEEKLGKLEKYFTEDTAILVTLSVEKERQKIKAFDLESMIILQELFDDKITII